MQLKSLLKDEVNLYQNSELEVYAQFVGYIENGLPQVIQNKLKANPNLKWDVQKRRKGDDKYFFNRNDFRVLRDKDDNKLSDNMINALYDYSVFSDNLYWTLNKGIDKYIDTVLHGQTGKTADQIKELRTTLRDKLMPNMKEGYFPHFTRDLSEDLLDGLIEVVLFEDIFKVGLTGSVIIADTNNLITNLPIVGQENKLYRK